MTELLFTVGIGVFFLTVYGAVMIGGHLLENLQVAEDALTDTQTVGLRVARGTAATEMRDLPARDQ